MFSGGTYDGSLGVVNWRVHRGVRAEAVGGGLRPGDKGPDAGHGDGQIGAAERIVCAACHWAVVVEGTTWRGLRGRDAVGAPAGAGIVDVQGVRTDNIDVLAVRREGG